MRMNHWPRRAALLLIGAAATACSKPDSGPKTSQAAVDQERTEESSIGTVSQKTAVTTWLWTEDFNTFKATRNTPASPYTSHNWYIQQHTNFNAEVQQYEDYLYNNSDTTVNAVGVTCNGASNTDTSCMSDSWVYKIDSGVAGAAEGAGVGDQGMPGDGKVLVMRTFRKNGQVFG